MTETVELPLWLVVLALTLAAVAALERVLMPSARWFLRRRAERLVARLNIHLARPIRPFRLMARADRIVQLTYDPKVMQAAMDHAQETGTPEPVAFEAARKAAREIVPGFSALVYFGVATRLARWLSRALYTVRVRPVDAALAGIDREATVVFVMNHRSNMDYVLVTWLVANRSALSYAVGEWARVWPLSAMIRAMGAYFIRRGSRDPLYRRVLARYVQIITAEGVTQAIFPEGGLSLDGRVGAARMGLLSYILQDFGPDHRDVVFVPVGIGYDRVLEDRLLVEAAAKGERRFRAGPLGVLGFLWRMARRKWKGTYSGFGHAGVAFGAPISLRDWLATHPADAEALGTALMQRVGEAVPVLPVPLAAAALRKGAAAVPELVSRAMALAQDLRAQGAVMELGEAPETALVGAFEVLRMRGMMDAAGQVPADQMALLAFQAGTVEQRISNSIS
ncbi:glycerol-3-phosphate 1-O-acyltransferase [Gemmobacter nanjingensis]|uniref:Glycerol-3-phosphate acyltransferase n=1 Tax=Gemmobacter nanjingensis TaxID=488454 RepID=A0ABQ3FCL6_9RHOB|nr:1-acyl-sn-glycerol-3-phosphate acyltransferase [Gemmobacter nanjingensis]GHC18583.1 glycerol-3-phosphate 1-O-acyltransferase [Gemmobacter nanjingensis]